MADHRYKFSYPLILTPLRSDVEVDFAHDAEAGEAIDKAVADYNRGASASRTCPKELVDVQKYKRQIGVTLVAADTIRSPGRALRTFSLKLLEYDYFKNLVSNDKKLFTTAYDKFDDGGPDEEQAHIPREILLKSVIDVIFSSDGNTVMNAALRELENLCLKYHLIEKYK